MASLQIDILAKNQSMVELEEIHERRHLYVHRGGYADEQYCHKFPNANASPGKLLNVEEDYLLRVLGMLEASALSIKNAIQTRFPLPTGWRYVRGERSLIEKVDQFVFASARVTKTECVPQVTDLAHVLPDGRSLKHFLIWVGTNDKHLRWLVAGNAADVRTFFKFLHLREQAGDFSNLETCSLGR